MVGLRMIDSAVEVVAIDVNQKVRRHDRKLGEVLESGVHLDQPSGQNVSVKPQNTTKERLRPSFRSQPCWPSAEATGQPKLGSKSGSLRADHAENTIVHTPTPNTGSDTYTETRNFVISRSPVRSRRVAP